MRASSQMASRTDIAMYIVLCSLAVLNRREVKEYVLDRSNIGSVLESDSQARDLLDAFFACEYKKSLSLLDRMSSRNLLDIHLSPHYSILVGQITRRALRQFVQPFDSLRIERLATSMGWQGKSGEEMAVDQLIGLIQNGEIKGKLDIIEKVSEEQFQNKEVRKKKSESLIHLQFVHRSIMPTKKTLVNHSSMAPSKWVSSEQHRQSGWCCE